MQLIGLYGRMTKYLPTGKELAICTLIAIPSGLVFGLILLLAGLRGDVYIMAMSGFSGAVAGLVIAGMRRNRRVSRS